MKITNAVIYSNMTGKKVVGLWGNLYPFNLYAATYHFHKWIVHSISRQHKQRYLHHFHQSFQLRGWLDLDVLQKKQLIYNKIAFKLNIKHSCTHLKKNRNYIL